MSRQLELEYAGIVPLKPTTFRLETEIMQALVAIRARDGIPVSEQVRRALTAWIAQRGVTRKADRPRAARTRKKGDAR